MAPTNSRQDKGNQENETIKTPRPGQKDKDRERLAVYHYARLLGAGRMELDASQRAAALLDVTVQEFKNDIWPRYKDHEGVKQAEELVRNSPGYYPDYF